MSVSWAYSVDDLPEAFDEYGDAIKLIIRPIFNGYVIHLIDEDTAVEATIRNLAARGITPESDTVPEHGHD